MRRDNAAPYKEPNDDLQMMVTMVVDVEEVVVRKLRNRFVEEVPRNISRAEFPKRASGGVEVASRRVAKKSGSLQLQGHVVEEDEVSCIWVEMSAYRSLC